MTDSSVFGALITGTVVLAIEAAAVLVWAGTVHQKLRDHDRQLEPVAELGKLVATLTAEVRGLNRRIDRERRGRATEHEDPDNG